MSLKQNSISYMRLSKELIKLQNEVIPGIKIEHPEDIFIWKAIIEGPEDTPYQNGKFPIILKFSDDYPVKPPSVQFLEKMFHPNIYRDGKVCVDILQNEWSPVLNIRTILLSLRSMLMDPNPNSPANRNAAILYTKNYTKYCETVKQTIK